MTELSTDKIVPLSMVETADQFLLVLPFSDSVYLTKNSPEILVDRFRTALDYILPIEVTRDPADPRRIVDAKPPDIANVRETIVRMAPKDDPQYTAEYWSATLRSPAAYQTDCAMWIAKVPERPFYRISFAQRAAFYYLHERHPHCQEIRQEVRKAINERRRVEVLLIQQFVCDVRIIESRPTPPAPTHNKHSK